MRVPRILSGLTIAAVVLTGYGIAGSAAPAIQPVAAVTTEQTAPVSSAVKASTTTVAAVQAAVAKKYAFPVSAKNVSWHKTHSGYPATDIFASCGSKFVATTNGVVLEISLKDKFKKGMKDGPYNGGLFVSILGDDGVRYYGSHLQSVQTGIKAGVRVKVGQLLGKVGHTGNASGVCHLHYGISAPCSKVGDWKVRRGVIWPYTFLASWRKGGQANPGKAMRGWRNAHHCKA